MVPWSFAGLVSWTLVLAKAFEVGAGQVVVLAGIYDHEVEEESRSPVVVGGVLVA